jgi:hypothetical protein
MKVSTEIDNNFGYEKKSLNSDGHQFHQYQQNEQSPLTLTELTEHKVTHDITTTMSFSIKGAR